VQNSDEERANTLRDQFFTSLSHLAVLGCYMALIARWLSD